MTLYYFIMSFLDMQLLCLGDITKNGCLAIFSIPLTVGGRMGGGYLWWRNVEKYFFQYEPPNHQHGPRCVRS